MSVEVRYATAADVERWDEYVERSSQATFFHQYDALQCQAEHTGATLHPLVGYKGEEPVGLFPAFELAKGPLTGVFSPPPYLWVGYLGPALLNTAKLSQRKTERRNEQFVEGCIERLRSEIGTAYLQITTPPGYDDVRPFKWSGGTVTPKYTYTVDLRPDEEALLNAFSSDARSNIRDAEAVDYSVEVGGHESIEWLLEQVRQRYEAQGRPYSDSDGFVVDLHDRLPDGQVRPYVLRIDGERIGGLLTVEDADTIYRWQGGVRPAADVDLAVNDVLDWHVMRSAPERGISSYDLVGAGDRSINRYKAKFAPELTPFYRIQDGAWGVPALTHVYRQISAIRHSIGVF
jgi:hypothetical protein